MSQSQCLEQQMKRQNKNENKLCHGLWQLIDISNTTTNQKHADVVD